jgi:hypothetical protein
MSAATDYLEEKIRKHILGITAFAMPVTVYVALHTANPTETGAVAECAGGGYARQACAFTDGGSSASNTATVRFNSVGAVTVTHYSLWDAVTLGNPLLYSALDTPQVLLANQPLEFNAAALVVAVA